MKVPFNELVRQTRSLEEPLRGAVERVVASGWYLNGPELEAFQEEFAAFCGVESCVGVGSGTDALELALRMGAEAGRAARRKIAHHVARTDFPLSRRCQGLGSAVLLARIARLFLRT